MSSLSLPPAPEPAPTLPTRAALPLWPLVSRKPLPVLHVISDLHLESGPYEIPAGLDFDILVAAGDIGPVEVAVPWLAKVDKPVVYVLGNHERWGSDFTGAVARARELAKGTQVRVLERDAVVIQGVRFLGATLWTDLREFKNESAQAVWRMMRDYHYVSAESWLNVPANLKKLEALCRRHDLPPCTPNQGPSGVTGATLMHPMMTYIEHHRSISWLRAQLKSTRHTGPTVVVSHHAPSYESLRRSGITQGALDVQRWSWKDSAPARIAGYASEVLKDSLSNEAKAIDLWIHGHVHVAMDYCEGGTRVLCNPRGAHRKPLTEEAAKSSRLLGWHVSPEDIARSQEAFKINPYRGHADNFEPRLTLALEAGLSQPLRKACLPMLDELRELQAELTELLPVAGLGQSILDRCATESFEARLEQVRNVAARVRDQVIPHLSRDERTFLPACLTPPNGAYLRSLWVPGEPLLPADFEAAVKGVAALLTWMQALPDAAQASLRAWAEKACQALACLQANGIRAEVALPGADALRRLSGHSVIRLISSSSTSAKGVAAACAAVQPVPSNADQAYGVSVEAAPSEDERLELILDRMVNAGRSPRTHHVTLTNELAPGTLTASLAQLQRWASG